MAVSAGRLVTILEAQTSQFDARMTAAAGVVERFTRPQVLAARAAQQLNIQMRSLTATALGASGPVGNLASSLLGLFGGTTGLIVGAGIGAIVLGVRAITRELDAATKRVSDLHREWVQLLQARGPGVGLAGRLTGLGGEAGLLERQTGLQDQAGITSGFMESIIGRLFRIIQPGTFARLEQQAEIGTNELRQLNPVIALVREALEEWRRDLKEAAALKSLTDTAERLAADVAGIKVPFGQIPGGPIVPLPSPAPLPAPSGAEMFAALRGADFNAVVEQLEQVNAVELQRSKVLAVLGNAEEVSRIHALGLGDALTILASHFIDTTEIVQKKALLMQIAIVNSISGAIASIISGGGLGSVLSFAGGLIGFVNPLAGAIVSGFGTIVSATENRRERHSEQQTAQIVEAIEENEREAIIVVRSGGEGDVAFEDQLVRTLERLSDRRILVRALPA